MSLFVHSSARRSWDDGTNLELKFMDGRACYVNLTVSQVGVRPGHTEAISGDRERWSIMRAAGKLPRAFGHTSGHVERHLLLAARSRDVNVAIPRQRIAERDVCDPF